MTEEKSTKTWHRRESDKNHDLQEKATKPLLHTNDESKPKSPYTT